MSLADPLLLPSCFALIGDIGGGELMVVLTAMLVLFGGKGLSGMARTLGKITRDLQRAAQDFKTQLLTDGQDESSPPPPPPGNATPPKELPPRDPSG
ncbi:MAG: twin-arginine translocase TatA/TatE family subunit [bacterium]